MRIAPRFAFALAFGLAVAFALVPVLALAQPSPYPAPTELTASASRPLPGLSVTISPVHLALPVVELATELRLGRSFGITAIAGGGTVEVLGERFRVYEVGGQVAWYLSGDFGGGFKLGLETLYAAVDGDAQGVRALGEGVSIGQFIGWKKVWSSGFTVDLQGGVAFYVARAEASESRTESPAVAREGTTSVGDAEVGPLLNLNLGWSF